MVDTTYPTCDNPDCQEDPPKDHQSGCDLSEKCVRACAAYGRICPCSARAAGKAACAAVQKLSEDSNIFTGKPDFAKLNSDDLVIGERLGEGGFSLVNQCTIRNSNKEELAIKYLKRTVMVNKKHFELGAADLAIEAHFLAALDHPNIVSLHGITAGSVETNVASGKECGFFIVVDRLYDTLEQRIEKFREEQEKTSGNILYRRSQEYKDKRKAALMERIRIAVSIADAMEYIHSRSIIYRDLKPDNIGFDKDGAVRLFDFGLAKELRPGQLKEDGTYELTGNTGSRRYMAPEIALEIPYNQSTDVYSFGILLWELCAAEKPFFGYSRGKHMSHVVLQGERPKMDASHAGFWPKQLKSLMKNCWAEDPTKRPSFAAIQQTLKTILEGTEPGCEPLSEPEDDPVDTTVPTKDVHKRLPGGFAGLKLPGLVRSSTVEPPCKIPPPQNGFASMPKPAKKGRARTWGFGRRSHQL